MTSGVSPGEVAARLVVEFCLPTIQGKRDAHAPVPGRQLDASERAEIGAAGEGMAMVFENASRSAEKEEGLVLDHG